MQGVIVVEDDSVQKKLLKTAKSLHKKYNKKRKINEAKYSKPVKKWQRVVAGLSTAFTILLIMFTCCLTMAVVVSRFRHTVPTFAGYSVLQVISPSMTFDPEHNKNYNGGIGDGFVPARGFEVGDTVVVRSVAADSLNVHDIIAFYVNQSLSSRHSSRDLTSANQTGVQNRTNMTFGSFFGFQPKAQAEAGSAGCVVYFHEITAIEVDENGERWFTTHGYANGSNDAFFTNEKMVVGVYDPSAFGKVVSGVLNGLTDNPYLLITITLAPLFLLAAMISWGLVRDIVLAWIELDVVEEKRKLTDLICVRNNIGMNMDTKTKYKVLAQAQPEEKIQYISLLWRSGSVPENVRKYYLRKQYQVRFNQQLLELNRQCEQMLKDKVPMDKIAAYYTEGKQVIEANRENHAKRVKRLRKIYAAKANEQKLAQQKADAENKKAKKANKKDKSAEKALKLQQKEQKKLQKEERKQQKHQKKQQQQQEKNIQKEKVLQKNLGQQTSEQKSDETKK